MNLPNCWTLLALSMLVVVGSAVATVEMVEGELVGTALLRGGGLQEALSSSSSSSSLNATSPSRPVPVVYHNIIEPPITDHDIEIMKKEINWGRNEMEKYKAFRGAWPVRTNSNAGDDNNVDETILRISKEKSATSYWEMLQVLSFY